MIGPDRKPIGYHRLNDCPGCSNNAQDVTYFSGNFEKTTHIRDQHILFYRSRNTTNILKTKMLLRQLGYLSDKKLFFLK
jgi:hypothetical protein